MVELYNVRDLEPHEMHVVRALGAQDCLDLVVVRPFLPFPFR